MAHAQKPEPQTMGYGPDTIAREIVPWIEQHCVAVLTDEHTIDHDKDGPISTHPIYIKPPRFEHIPEQTLKLRCQ
jgi:hypothetical protein